MALNITVNSQYKITSDERNVIVNRKIIVDPTKAPNWAKRQAEGADPTPREEWREVSYHSTLDKALAAIIDQEVLDSDATTLAEIISEIREFQREIKALVYG